MHNSIYTKSNIIYNDQKSKSILVIRGEERNGIQRGLWIFGSDGNILYLITVVVSQMVYITVKTY